MDGFGLGGFGSIESWGSIGDVLSEPDSYEVDFSDVLINLLPKGALWQPNPEGDFQKLLAGIGDAMQGAYSAVDALAYIRDPRRTSLLRDLEKDYGQPYISSLSELQRRSNLAAIKYARKTTNSWESLQDLLVNAGFTDALVIPNGPVIDPDIILAANGELIVNGPIYSSQRPNYLMCAGGDIAYAGHDRAYAGSWLTMQRTSQSYDVGDIPQRWPFVFFVGSVKSGTWPSAPTVTALDVPSEQEYFLKQLLLSKPSKMWCVLCANYV
jgi:hypothetical protein